jgi:hypothetical protein
MYMGQSRNMSGNTGTTDRLVGLLVSCLPDLYCPDAGFTVVKWLGQGCCSQPIFNGGNDPACVHKIIVAD